MTLRKRSDLSRPEWQKPEVSGDVPGPRRRYAVTVCGGDLYLFGGSSKTQDDKRIKYHNDLYKLSDDSGVLRWTRIRRRGHVPPRRDGHSLISHNNQLYLFGGSSTTNPRVCLPGLYTYDLGFRRWEYTPTQGSSPQTLAHTMTRVGWLVFVFGGHVHGSPVNSLWMLHIQYLTWTRLSTSGEPPAARSHHTSAAIGDRLYIHGGCSGHGVWYNDLHILDICTLSWSQPMVDRVPSSPQGSHSFLAYRKTLYIFGGGQNAMSRNQNLLHTYDTASESSKWSELDFCGHCVENRPGQSLAVLHGQLYVFGGCGNFMNFHDMRSLRISSKDHRRHMLRCTSGSRRTEVRNRKNSCRPRPKVHTEYIRLNKQLE